MGVGFNDDASLYRQRDRSVSDTDLYALYVGGMETSLRDSTCLNSVGHEE